MKVFVSSTYSDLKGTRARVIKHLEDAGVSPVRMEVFGARPETSLETSLAELRGSVLAENLARLRKEAERQQAFFTNIADPMRARQVARALGSHMQSQGRLALSAQLQPLPGAMMRLLTEDAAQAPRLGREC